MKIIDMESHYIRAHDNISRSWKFFWLELLRNLMSSLKKGKPESA